MVLRVCCGTLVNKQHHDNQQKQQTGPGGRGGELQAELGY